MQFNLKHILLLLLAGSIGLAWLVDRVAVQRSLGEKDQQLAAMRIKAARPPVLGLYLEEPQIATKVDAVASLLYKDIAKASGAQDIARAYKRSKNALAMKGDFKLLAARILEINSWDNYDELENVMKECCVEVPGDREDFVRFLGFQGIENK